MVRLKSDLLLGLAPIFLSIQSILAHGAQRRNICPAKQAVTKVIYLESFYINTFVQQNTTFNINKNIAVTITNAPTILDLVLIGSATRWITSSRNTYSTTVYFSLSLPSPSQADS